MAASPFPAPPPPGGPSAFRLIRFYSLASLVGIALVTACLIWAYRDLTERQLVNHESRANADQTRAFANSVWNNYRDFVLGSTGRTRADLLADPVLQRLHADVLARMHGLQIAKMKIYNLDGLTVYSTDFGQIGEIKHDNQGFVDARTGAVASQISYREKFDAFEGVIEDRSLISSYVPIRAGPDSAVEGVAEVYSDVTEMLALQSRSRWQVAGIVLALLSTLYLFLFLVVRKGDAIIRRQDAERAASEQQVRHQAYHDTLTGLPNRAYFAIRLAETLALASRHGHKCALMFVDLDRFKIVNDSLGHPAGDELLQEVSRRILTCLRSSDLLFRMGGDEFTVILPEIASPDDAAHVARRILGAVAQPVVLHEHELSVGATVGIAVHPGDGDDAESLLCNADAAMYAAKEAGRGSHAFYRAEMNQRARQRSELELALHRAFREGELTLRYEPRLRLPSGRVQAMQASLHWNHPARRNTAPAELVAMVEDAGLQGILGEWALRQACLQAARWQREGADPSRVAIGLSRTQFEHRALAETVRRVLDETGVEPASIQLELDGALLVDGHERARSKLAALKALGVRIGIDGFGACGLSFDQLRSTAFDAVKLDAAVASAASENPRDRALAGALVEMAHALGATVVAEGVRTQAQAESCLRLACDEGQGPWYGPPLPVDQLGRPVTVPA